MTQSEDRHDLAEPATWNGGSVAPLVDPEFVSLIPPLSADERKGLETNVKEHGCVAPLVAWVEENILLDGHNRFGICRENDIPFQVRGVSLPDRSAARRWIITNQLGRRNLTAEGMAVLRGQLYNETKLAHGGSRASGNSCHLKAEDVVAEQCGVSPRTVRNDAAFATALRELSAILGDDIREKVLSRDARISRKDIVALAGLEEAERLAAVEATKEGASATADLAVVGRPAALPCPPAFPFAVSGCLARWSAPRPVSRPACWERNPLQRDRDSMTANRMRTHAFSVNARRFGM